MNPDLRGHRVLVTGGTGFIGGRLVEKLVLQHGARVRVLTSRVSGAARVSRFDVELVKGDVADADTVAAAARDCDVVFHCAYGGRGTAEERHRGTVDSARAVLEAGVGPGAPRIVLASTMVVYGSGVEGDLDESAPRHHSGIEYADAKIAAEELAFRYAAERGVAMSVIQPTAVYGPYGPSWTMRVLDDLRRGQVVLVDGGIGHANPVYVDDVVDVMLLAAVRDEAIGEAFLVASGETVTWKEFYARFERMLGVRATVSMTSAKAKAYYARAHRRRSILAEFLAIARSDSGARARLAATREAAAFYPMIRRLGELHLMPSLAPTGAAKHAAWSLPKNGGPRRVLPVHPKQVDFLAARTRVKIDKARELLGFVPAFDFARGSALTEAWARWAHLLGEERP